MARRFFSVLLTISALATPVFAQFAEQSLPPPKIVSEPSQPVPTPRPLTVDDPLPATTAPSAVDRWWFGGNYILGWGTPTHLPPLVTTSPAGTKQPSVGVIGLPTTSVLVGNENVDNNLQMGFKLDGGCWFDQYNTLGVTAGFFMIFGRSQNFLDSSNGSTILARPFINANNDTQTSLLVAFPNGSGPTGVKSSGSISVKTNSGPFYSASVDFQENVYRDANFYFNTLLGYRFLRFDDGLQISQSMHPTGGGFATGTQLDAQDNFTAHNTFNGIDIGFETQYQMDRWAFGLLAKVAAGRMENIVNINGGTQISVPGSPTSVTSGGLLAQKTNSGNHQVDMWTAAPEIGLNLSWNVTNNVRLSLGYSFLWFFDVARASDQIDMHVNPAFLNSKLIGNSVTGSAARPVFEMHESSLLLQTISLGVEYRF